MVDIGEEYQGEIFSSVVIDGNNAITEKVEVIEGRKKFFFRLERLKNTIDEVEKLGWRTKTVLKQTTYNYCLKPDSTLTDIQKESLQQMESLGMIHLISPSEDKDIDDKIMIRHALDHDSWILTHDSFKKDHIPLLMKNKKFDVANEIKNRKVKLLFGPDHKPIFCLPYNEESLAATKIISDTQNIELELLNGGCQILLEVEGIHDVNGIIPMREPVGRGDLLNFAKHDMHKTACEAVSRRHFKIDWDGSRYYITDIGSTNGTKLNEMKIPPHQPQKITSQDIISIGRVKFRID